MRMTSWGRKPIVLGLCAVLAVLCAMCASADAVDDVFGTPQAAAKPYRGAKPLRGDHSDDHKDDDQPIGSGTGAAPGSSTTNRGRVRSSKIVTLTDSNFDETVNPPWSQWSIDRNWIVVFTAEWCVHCTALKPELALAAETLATENVFVGVADIDLAPGIASRFLITRIPAIYHVDGRRRVRPFPAHNEPPPRSAADVIAFAHRAPRDVSPVFWLLSPFGVLARIIGLCAAASTTFTSVAQAIFSRTGAQIVLSVLSCVASYVIFAKLSRNDDKATTDVKVGPIQEQQEPNKTRSSSSSPSADTKKSQRCRKPKVPPRAS